MSIAALVVSRYKSPAGIGESERHALHCGLWILSQDEMENQPTTTQPQHTHLATMAASSSSSSSFTFTWTGYTWIDHPLQWTHLRSLLEQKSVSLLHLHGLDKLVLPPSVVERLQALLVATTTSTPSSSSVHHSNNSMHSSESAVEAAAAAAAAVEAAAAAPLSVRVQVHDTLPSTPLPQLLKQYGISPMHIIPQLDTRVLHQAAIFALALGATLSHCHSSHNNMHNDNHIHNTQLKLSRMPHVMHLDAPTARDTLHVWPPANQGHAAVVVGGTASTHSLYGLLACTGSSSSNGQSGRQQQHPQQKQCCYGLATMAGKRLWAQWLHQPLFNVRALQDRQEAVAFFVSHGVARDSLHGSLRALMPLDCSHLAQQLLSFLNYSATISTTTKTTTTTQATHYADDDYNDLSPGDHEGDAFTSSIATGNSSNGNKMVPPPSAGSTRKALQALYHLYLLANQKVPLIFDALADALEQYLPPQSTGDSSTDTTRTTINSTTSTIPILLEESFRQLQTAEAQLRNAGALAESVLDLDHAPREFLVQASYREELQDVQTELQNTLQLIDEALDCMNHVWSRTGGSGSSSSSSSQSVKLERTTDGFQFRIPDANAEKVLRTLPDVHVHRLLKNGVYFSTKDLLELSCSHKDLLIQYDSYQRQIVAEAMPVAATFVTVLDALSPCLAQLDVLVALASLASHKNYCRPFLTNGSMDMDEEEGNADSGGCIALEEARHPCGELHMEFIPNNVRLERHRSSFMIVTGPNMGGKSTYLRATGAIVTLAQVGSFVPCTSATIQIVDAILARVGAGDSQDRGISTFMAEMLDSAAILSRATSRSLILIDELGRGTSTYDGYGLARAIAEYIVRNISSFAVFTTHFHELTALSETHKEVVNYHVTAQKSASGSGDLVFLYQVQPGPCLESFGIQVAEMAQVPAVVIADAKRKALELEKFEYRKRCPTRNTHHQSIASTNHEEEDASSVSAATFMTKFRKADIPGVFRRFSGASDHEKRVAILTAMGESLDVLDCQ